MISHAIFSFLLLTLLLSCSNPQDNKTISSPSTDSTHIITIDEKQQRTSRSLLLPHHSLRPTQQVALSQQLQALTTSPQLSSGQQLLLTTTLHSSVTSQYREMASLLQQQLEALSLQHLQQSHQYPSSLSADMSAVG